MSLITHAITCTGPFAVLIMLGIKRVENRFDRPVPAKGRCEDAARVFREALPIAGVNEGFFVLPLDSDRRILSAPILVSLGDAVTAVVTPGAVFSAALREEAAAIVVAHNHPSGDPTPSRQDRELTAALKALGESLGVMCLDHLVLGRADFVSVSGKVVSR